MFLFGYVKKTKERINVSGIIVDNAAHCNFKQAYKNLVLYLNKKIKVNWIIFR